MSFDPGRTGEKKDDVLSSAAVRGSIQVAGVFDPFDTQGLPAVFTAGIVTDVGELIFELSAQELSFQTDGPIICGLVQGEQARRPAGSPGVGTLRLGRANPERGPVWRAPCARAAAGVR